MEFDQSRDTVHFTVYSTYDDCILIFLKSMPQAALCAGLVGGKPTFGLSLLLELIAVGDFGGGEVVYTGTNSPEVIVYRPYTRYPVQRRRKPEGQRGAGTRSNFRWWQP